MTDPSNRLAVLGVLLATFIATPVRAEEKNPAAAAKPADKAVEAKAKAAENKAEKAEAKADKAAEKADKAAEKADKLEGKLADAKQDAANARAEFKSAIAKLREEVKEGKLKKLVNAVEHVTFSGPRGVAQGQDITYVTERCVMKLTPEGIVLTEIAPGVDLKTHILDQSEFPLIVAPDLKLMDATLFREANIGLSLPAKSARTLEGTFHG